MTAPSNAEQVTATIRVDVQDPAGFRRYAFRRLELVERHGARVIAAGLASALVGEPSSKATWRSVQHWASRAHFDRSPRTPTTGRLRPHARAQRARSCLS